MIIKIGLLCVYLQKGIEGTYVEENPSTIGFRLEINKNNIIIEEGIAVHKHKLYRSNSSIYFYDDKQKIFIMYDNKKLRLVPVKPDRKKLTKIIFIINFIKK